MCTATFTYAKRQFDDDFHSLDRVIAGIARPCTWRRPESHGPISCAGRLVCRRRH
jgi:hypothetical protein